MEKVISISKEYLTHIPSPAQSATGYWLLATGYWLLATGVDSSQSANIHLSRSAVATGSQRSHSVTTTGIKQHDGRKVHLVLLFTIRPVRTLWIYTLNVQY